MNRPTRKNFTSRKIPQKTTSCSLFRSQRFNKESEEDMCHTDLYAYIKVFGTDEQRERLVQLKSKVRRTHLLPLYREVLNNRIVPDREDDYFTSTDYDMSRLAYMLSKNADYKNILAKILPELLPEVANALVFRVERFIESRRGITNTGLRQNYENTLNKMFANTPAFSAENIRDYLEGVFR